MAGLFVQHEGPLASLLAPLTRSFHHVLHRKLYALISAVRDRPRLGVCRMVTQRNVLLLRQENMSGNVVNGGNSTWKVLTLSTGLGV